MVLIFLFAASTRHIVALVKAYVRVMERHVFYNIIVIVAQIFHVTGVIICVVLALNRHLRVFVGGHLIDSSTFTGGKIFEGRPYLENANAIRQHPAANIQLWTANCLHYADGGAFT